MPAYSPYAYGFNDPVNFTDPTGMAPCPPGADCPGSADNRGIIRDPSDNETQRSLGMFLARGAFYVAGALGANGIDNVVVDYQDAETTGEKVGAAASVAAAVVVAANTGGAGKAGKGAALAKNELRAAKLNKVGKPMTKAGKDVVKTDNRIRNDGEMKCADCGTGVQNGTRHTKGNTPPSNEAHIDHKNPRSLGGRGNPDNGQVLCRTCNLEKGAKPN